MNDVGNLTGFVGDLGFGFTNPVPLGGLVLTGAGRLLWVDAVGLAAAAGRAVVSCFKALEAADFAAAAFLATAAAGGFEPGPAGFGLSVPHFILFLSVGTSICLIVADPLVSSSSSL